MKNLLVAFGLFLLFGQSAFASSAASDTVVEFTEKVGDITSSSTSDDKTEARQLLVESENYYANPAAPMGVELTKQAKQFKQQHPNTTTNDAVDYIYENIR